MERQPAQRLLSDWFGDGLTTNPHGPALSIMDHSWTYAEVDRLARAWAATLVRDVGGPPRATAVVASKTPEAYIGFLAALYTGAIAVPLNPEVPVARNRQVIAAAGCDALITDAAGAEQVSSLTSGTPVRSVLGPQSTVEDGDGFTPARPDPGNIAYILFTSGSTGVPKGVPISHANISAFLAASVNRYRATPADRFSQVHETTFDLALCDIFPAWAAGACVCVLTRLQALDPARWIRRYGLTVWHSTPSLPRVLQARDLLPAGCLAGLRLSVFAGEQLLTATAGYWARAAPGTVVENIYGPTEAAVACTTHRWDPGRDTGAAVPIGRPHAGVSLLVLDDEGRPVTGDEVGELYLSGPQVFTGYLDPADDAGWFQWYGGRRWYRTGDHVRARGDGALLHLGREDSQVKINGYRVELGEVEAALRVVAGGSADVVAFAVHTPTGAVLTACVLGDPEPRLSDMSRALADRLPQYMLPRHLWWLPAAPLTAHGKTDRLALRAEAVRRIGAVHG